MKFGWINLFGAAIVVLMLIPNIIYAVKNKDEKNLCTNKLMNIIEQAGRYACIVLMWLPLLVWEFGFKSVNDMLTYVLVNCALIISYWLMFARYFKKKTKHTALTLAIIPSMIFTFSALLLRHWLLLAFAVVFAVGHNYVTNENAKALQ